MKQTHPEKSFVFAATWTCSSRPTTVSHPPFSSPSSSPPTSAASASGLPLFFASAPTPPPLQIQRLWKAVHLVPPCRRVDDEEGRDEEHDDDAVVNAWRISCGRVVAAPPPPPRVTKARDRRVMFLCRVGGGGMQSHLEITVCLASQRIFTSIR